MYTLPMESQLSTQIDRRHKPRIECTYPAQVRGRSANGSKFRVQARLSNLSATGLYLQLDRRVEPGSRLFVLIHLTKLPKESKRSPAIAARGPVVRSEIQSDGKCGLAIRFDRHRFVWENSA